MEKGIDVTTIPEILAAEDVARLFHVSLSESRRLIAGGRLGRHFKLGRRHFVQRAAFFEALAAMETPAHPACGGLLRRRLVRASTPGSGAEIHTSDMRKAANS